MTRAFLFALLAVLVGACAAVSVPDDEPGLALEIEGNRTFTHAELWTAIHESVGGFAKSKYQKSLVDDAAFELERFYLSQGFAFATVQYEYDGPEANPRSEDVEKPRNRKARAVLLVDEGPRVELSRVSFRGGPTVKGTELRAFFEVDDGSVLDLEDKVWFVEDRVRSGVDRVSRHYFDRGFLDAYVAPPEIRFSLDRTKATVDVWIREGEQHRLAAVEITGDLPFPEDELRSAYTIYLEKPYFERVSPEVEGRIEDYYADRGYADVVIERNKREIDAQGRVTLGFEVRAGTLVHVGEVKIEGNEQTRSRFIRSRLLLQPGARFDRSKERTSFARLYRTGLFDNVKLGLAKEPGETRDLEIQVTEVPTLELFLEPGWGSYEELRFGVGAREKNLFGTGKILQAEGSVSRPDQHGKLSLIDPWFLGSEITADLSLFGGVREEPGFTRREVGSGIQFGKRVTSRIEVSTGYTFKKSEISDVETILPLSVEEVDDVDISSIGVAATYDSRNIVFAPTKGSLTKIAIELAAAPLGSELEFVRVAGTQSNFFRFNSETSLGASFRTGWIAPVGETDTIPLQERYFNGGESTVRSFQEDELGPKDVDRNPLGGEAFTVVSVELRRKLWGKLHAGIFCDFGNVEPDHNDYFEFKDMRPGVGLGLRYELPVGPIRLDGAINPNPREDEDSGALHFSVGMAF